MLETILQLLITGVALGFVYALVGVEYTLVWQSSGLLNVAHNMLITTAAFVFGGTFVVGLGWPIWLSILCTLVVMFVLGCLISATIFNPLRNMPLTMYSIVGTQIFAKVISEALRLIYGPYSFTIPGSKKLRNNDSGTCGCTDTESKQKIDDCATGSDCCQCLTPNPVSHNNRIYCII